MQRLSSLSSAFNLIVILAGRCADRRNRKIKTIERDFLKKNERDRMKKESFCLMHRLFDKIRVKKSAQESHVKDINLFLL